jgi:uncharacterized protein (DUF1015 family)
MAKIAPFRAFHYNSEIIPDLSLVTSPPYDIIDERGQEALYQKHAYNYVRLDFGKEVAGDAPGHDKYSRAAEYFEEWGRRGILVQDEAPAIYFLEQKFKVGDETKRRRGFIALMRLEEPGEATRVHPHERTHTAPKEDRLRLMEALPANLSQIFTVYSDDRQLVRSIFEERFKNRPADFIATDAAGVENKMWRLSEASAVEWVMKDLAEKEVFIADGHHRFEVAKNFRQIRPLADHVMTYFTPIEDEGVVILPTHRLIKDISVDFGLLAPYFRAQERPGQDDLILEMRRLADQAGVFGLYQDKKFFLITMKDKAACRRLMGDVSRDAQGLDVLLLHKALLEPLLKISLDKIRYDVDVTNAARQVDQKAYASLFILNATRIDQVRAIALGGGVMPQKSTYFYPKLLSGMLIHKF